MKQEGKIIAFLHLIGVLTVNVAMPNYVGIQLTGLQEAPKFRMKCYVVRGLESQER